MSVHLAAGPKRVDFAAVERELEALWMSMPAPGGSDSTAMTMRAVVANLVVVRDSESDMDAAADVIGKIIGNNPCRMIMVTSEPDTDPPELSAEVAVVCQQSETCRRCVCCDRIRLTGRGIMADNLPSAAAGLLVPDLPSVLWCLKPPFGRKDFERFAEQSDRVIVDSAGYSRDDLKRLARFVEASRRIGTAVSDLNWARLTAQRQVFAQFFDSPECRERLAAVHSLRVEASLSMGLLLAGWLQAQLNKSGYPLRGEQISVIPGGAAAPSFQSLALACAQGNNSFAVTRRDDATLEARSVLDGKDALRVAITPAPTDDKLLGDELMFSGRDAVFETALAAATALPA